MCSNWEREELWEGIKPKVVGLVVWKAGCDWWGD